MDEPKSLDSLFKEKIFRIPDFQRGYAWQGEQFRAFWEDIINLSEGRSHYTGVLTLKEVPQNEVKPSDNEYWLVDDHSYRMYYVIDGQQRLTTFIIFLQSFIDVIRGLPEYKNIPDNGIIISNSLPLIEIVERYLYRVKPTGDRYRTYKFGYTVDNPSHDYLRYMIFQEQGQGSLQKTFYTLNLENAKRYFYEQIQGLYDREGLDGLQNLYKKLTRRLLFNEYIIKDEFDVFIAFETMNNRGKKLSDLELLKNRMIYLTTLYEDSELDPAGRRNLREDINSTWKEVYCQLGRNEKRPLNDDDFLRAHWIMYYKYSRKTGRDYIRFLLEEQFTPKNVLKKVERPVELDEPEEQQPDLDFEEADQENGEDENGIVTTSVASLKPTEIRDYVHSLKESSVHWFNSYFPDKATSLDTDEVQALDRLNRIGIGYFRPLVMAVLKNEKEKTKRLRIFNRIESFIFLVFRMANTRSNYGSSEFYIAAREFERGEIGPSDLESQIRQRMTYLFHSDNALKIDDFYSMLRKKFENGTGYYGWSGLRYFLYEYELSLLAKGIQQKLGWDDLLRTAKDKISIEHIYPQSETDYWVKKFKAIPKRNRGNYMNSLGNLLILSMSINSSLQNDSFEDKKQPKFNSSRQKVRNGYADGSHSEIEVSKYHTWGPEQLRERGLKLLDFMAKRWGFVFKNDAEKEKLLFIK